MAIFSYKPIVELLTLHFIRNQHSLKFLWYASGSVGNVKIAENQRQLSEITCHCRIEILTLYENIRYTTRRILAICPIY